MHPHLAGGDLVEPVQQFVQGDVDGAVDVRLGPFQVAPDVEDDHAAVVADLGEVGEGGPSTVPSGPSVQSSGSPVAAAAGRSMPIRTSSRCACATWSGSRRAG